MKSYGCFGEDGSFFRFLKIRIGTTLTARTRMTHWRVLWRSAQGGIRSLCRVAVEGPRVTKAAGIHLSPEWIWRDYSWPLLSWDSLRSMCKFNQAGPERSGWFSADAGSLCQASRAGYLR